MNLPRLARKLLGRTPTPTWLTFPSVIQIDTNNHCGPRHCKIFCRYCYPQWAVSTGLRRHMEMPMEWIEWILRQMHRYGKRMGFVDWFLNGDGLTEPRLPEILALSKKYMPKLMTQTFTCGVLTENVDRILDRNLDSICFTISAHNPELYQTVHRGDRFHDAIETLETVLEKRHPAQKVSVHCVLNKYNIKHVKGWWEYFGKYEGLNRVLSPLVASYGNTPSKKALGDLTLDEQEQIVLDVAGEKGRMWIRALIGDEMPCVLWNNMSIDVEGYILQCCNWSPPEEINYGLIQELMEEGRTLQEVWIERLANRMRNPLCKSCNMRHPQWKKRLQTMKIFSTHELPRRLSDV